MLSQLQHCKNSEYKHAGALSKIGWKIVIEENGETKEQHERMSDVIGNKVWNPMTKVAFDYTLVFFDCSSQ